MKYTVKVTLNEKSRAESRKMREIRGIETPADFEGPVFKGVGQENVTIVEGFVHITLDDGSIYSYNKDSVARVAFYPESE